MRNPRAWFYRVVWQNGVIDHLTPAKFREIKAAYPGFNREAVHGGKPLRGVFLPRVQFDNE